MESKTHIEFLHLIENSALCLTAKNTENCVLINSCTTVNNTKFEGLIIFLMVEFSAENKVYRVICMPQTLGELFPKLTPWGILLLSCT